MKRLSLPLATLALCASVFVQLGVAESLVFERASPRPGQKYVQGEILVKFKPSVTEDAIAELNSSLCTSVLYVSPLAGFTRLRIPTDTSVAEMVGIYNADANVEYAEANYIAYAMMAPNDELYPLQWHLYNPGFGGIQLESAWDIITGEGVVVAILDTGIAFEVPPEDTTGWESCCEQAPDLAETCFVPGYDFVNNDDRPYDDSSPGHGTHVAGTVAQSTGNTIGTAGVAPQVCLMPVKVLDNTGAGTYADVADGIIWATQHGAHVINLGLGGSEPSVTLENAAAYAWTNGAVVVAAAGNGRADTVSYPAAYNDYVIAVGATRYDETLAYYSNYGPDLDLTAPGGDLSVDQNADGYGDGILQQTFALSDSGGISWGYYFMEGTSMATAHVSAVAALVIAKRGVNSPTDVRNTLQITAEDKGPIGWDREYGWGIVDAYASVQRIGPPLVPVADFLADTTIGPKPLTVQFIDQSMGSISSWLWDFGDGEKSTLQNPPHTYQDACHYTVTLTITGPSGSHSRTKTNYINAVVPLNPAAEFVGEPKTGDLPLTVQFNDQSTCLAVCRFRGNGGTSTGHMDYESLGGITSWSWDFGDGVTSTDQHPDHVYQNSGDYTVSLKVTGPGGSDSVTKVKYVNVAIPTPPVAEFDADPNGGMAPMTVQFTDKSTGGITDWSWDFGDGAKSGVQNPAHMYENAGKYTVSLTLIGPTGSDTKTVAECVSVAPPPPPQADFVADPNSGEVPLAVQFTDRSTGRISTRSWDFGDGATSGARNPAYTYENAGKYTVSLTLIGPTGSDTKTVAECISVAPQPPPQADFVADPNSGEVPLAVQFTDRSTGRISTRSWDFGDGATSSIENPTHTYESAGDYTVSLTLTGPTGTDVETKTNYIHVEPLLVAHVTIDKSRQYLGLLWARFVATVTIRNKVPDGLPIENAIVEGHWSGYYTGAVTGTTNNEGTVTFKTDWMPNSRTTTFTFDKVTKDGRKLAPAGETSE